MRKNRGTAVFVTLLLLIGLAAATVYGVRALALGSMSRAADAEQTTLLSFNVDKGETAASVAARLEARGLIRSGFAFSWVASMREIDERFHPGSYRLSKSMTGDEILQKLTSSSAEIRVTLPEGLTARDIAQRLSDVGITDPFSLRDCVKTCLFDLPILAGRPSGADLEGYLFPDTYDFTTGMEAREVLDILVRTFDRRLSQELRDKITLSGHSLFEIITVASLVEKEVSGPRDRRIVSGIIWKRLELGIPLGIDAATIYALGGNTELTAKNLQVDSPYNTRTNTGLPPGPICNPGLDAIRAALEPEQTDWLFYLSDPQGVTRYAKTNAEHEANKAKYL